MSLPSHYLITPNGDNSDQFLGAVRQSLQAGTRLMQLKAKGLDAVEYAALAEQVVALAHEHDCRVLLSGDPKLVQTLGADGLHLDSTALQATDARPLADDYLFAVSGHNLEALQRGESIGADFAVLSPVNYTKAHPDIEPLGWEGFGEIADKLKIPVYALGGVTADDEQSAIDAGGQGVAGNKGYWKG